MSAQNPLVSIVIPVYNCEKYIETCINSVVNQNYKNIEIIIVNDGSADGSLAIINYFKRLDNRIVCIDKQNNEGLVLARRSGVSIARGKYIQHLDSDDSLLEGSIERLVNIAEETGADIVAAPFYFCYSGKEPIHSGSLRFNETTGVEYYNEILAEHAYWSVWSNFHKRSLEEDSSIVMFPEISMMEDAVLMMQLIFKSDKIVALNEPILNYNKHDYAMTASLDQLKCEQMQKIEAWMERYIIEKGLQSQLGYGLAQRQLRITFDTIYYHRYQNVNNNIDRLIENLKIYPNLSSLLSKKQKIILHGYRVLPISAHLMILCQKIKIKILKTSRWFH